MRPLRPLVLLALAFLLSGCAAAGGQGFDQVTARLHNDGSTSLAVPLTITADGKTLLSETVTVPGHGTAERSVDAVPRASYTLHATYHAVRDSGSNHQVADGERSHTLEWDDCAGGTVVVTFSFTYSATATSQQFNSGTSTGSCEP
jgi:hypothetical protein